MNSSASAPFSNAPSSTPPTVLAPGELAAPLAAASSAVTAASTGAAASSAQAVAASAAPATSSARRALHTAASFLGCVLCVIFAAVIAVNVTLLVKSQINSSEVPSLLGVAPMVVLSDSMYPEIQSGDLIFTQVTDAQDVQVGDIIAFFDPASTGSAVVTHRVEALTQTDAGTLGFITKGDANNAQDSAVVPAENLVGVYTSRIAGAGNIAMFMQTTAGLVVCVVVPVCIIAAYSIVSGRIHNRKREQEQQRLLAELEQLRATGACGSGEGQANTA